MKKSIATLSLTLLTVCLALAQGHQPTLEDCKLMFQDYYYLKDWEKARKNLEFILENSPEEDEKYYVKGIKVYEYLMKDTEDEEIIKSYQDRAIQLYRQRFDIYGQDEQVQNQYLSSIYRYWIKTPAKYDSLSSLFQARFDENISAVSSSNFLAYFDVMRRTKAYKMPLDETLVLNNYDNILPVINERGDEKGYMEKIEQLLFDIVPMNCEKIESIYGKDLSELASAKRYLNMIIKKDCQINEKGKEAIAQIIDEEPSYKLAMYAARRSIIDNRLSDAQKYLAVALAEASNSEEEGDAYLELAKTMTLDKNKLEAHKFAKKAIAKNNNKEAYKLIGNLYMSSFSECVGDKDIVARRAVFIAAYDKFKKANDTKNMALAAAQFPTMEEIHFNNYELGQSMIVDCWFKEEVVIAKRVTE